MRTRKKNIKLYIINNNMYIPNPNDWFSPSFKKWFFAFLLSTLVILSVMSSFDIVAFISIVILAVFFYIIIENVNGVNYSALPYATYPNPPHLGLDGISIENRFTM